MKKIYLRIALSFLMASPFLQIFGQIGRQLDIPGRLQWDNDNGYCGETSIQMIGLYYGNYISQEICRTVAGGEVLVGSNEETALNALSFTYQAWNYNQAAPQYQNHLVWMKQHINSYHPVIFTVFIAGMNQPEYDHIICATGFTGANTTIFQNSDQLMYNSCYDAQVFTRTFERMWDTRSMNGNGLIYDYCIPRDVDFGCAVTGIKDDQHVTKPVHLAINRWDEPNVSIGEPAELLTATITIEGLTIGETYQLFRYDNYATVPSSGFSATGAAIALPFTATGTTQTFSDTFMSDWAVFYRCIDDLSSTSSQAALLDQNKFLVYPNPSNGCITIDTPESAFVEIMNAKGQTMKSFTIAQISNSVDVSDLITGIYFLKFQTKNGALLKKLVIE